MASKFLVVAKPPTYEAMKLELKNYAEVIAFAAESGGVAYVQNDVLYIMTDVGPLPVVEKGFLVRLGNVLYPMTEAEFNLSYTKL